MHPDWFQTWFDSPYYHLLYGHRDNAEADAFVKNIKHVLQLPAEARVLDLACGQGRHSRALAALGYNVTGADLSRASIEKARLSENDHLNFVVHDMRRPVAVNYFHAVLNLFTSFGYFYSVRDNMRTIDAVHASLKDDGIFLIDYFNSECVQQAVAAHASGSKDVSGVHFEWKKYLENGKVVKEIKVNDNGQVHEFCESVALFSPEDFSRMLNGKFEIMQTFGDYSLSAFDPKLSPRLILICKKK